MSVQCISFQSRMFWQTLSCLWPIIWKSDEILARCHDRPIPIEDNDLYQMLSVWSTWPLNIGKRHKSVAVEQRGLRCQSLDESKRFYNVCLLIFKWPRRKWIVIRRSVYYSLLNEKTKEEAFLCEKEELTIYSRFLDKQEKAVSNVFIWKVPSAYDSILFSLQENLNHSILALSSNISLAVNHYWFNNR